MEVVTDVGHLMCARAMIVVSLSHGVVFFCMFVHGRRGATGIKVLDVDHPN